jgi:hypothetical protein
MRCLLRKVGNPTNPLSPFADRRLLALDLETVDELPPPYFNVGIGHLDPCPSPLVAEIPDSVC